MILYKKEAVYLSKIIEMLGLGDYKIANELTKQDEQKKVRHTLAEKRGELMQVLNDHGWNYHNGELKKIAE